MGIGMKRKGALDQTFEGGEHLARNVHGWSNRIAHFVYLIFSSFSLSPFSRLFSLSSALFGLIQLLVTPTISCMFHIRRFAGVSKDALTGVLTSLNSALPGLATSPGS